ncbi:hypothetical protein JCM10908_000670, partial [Rhodotorula pacifica]|uniref:uncharacterized protein n=1 Tax=Rhodotorula pacifica TaxID=1495444 RepID=UPI00317E2D69
MIRSPLVNAVRSFAARSTTRRSTSAALRFITPLRSSLHSTAAISAASRPMASNGVSSARSASTQAGPPIKLSNPSLWVEKGGYVNGKWTVGSNDGTFEVINPGTGKVLGTLPEMTVRDTKEAINHAHEALKSWRKTSEYERSAILTKIFQIMSDNKEDLAQIITAENGKPLADARGEVTYGASYFSWYAGEAVRNYGDVIPSSVPGVQNTTIKQPIGVCAI